MSHAKTQTRKGFEPPLAPLLLCVGLLLLSVRTFAAPPDPDAAATVVVFNERDASSIELAGYYADRRGIPYDHLIGLSCPLEETVSRADYDKTIGEPLRKAFLAHGWWKLERGRVNGPTVQSTIRYVALMRGIPLKIAGAADVPGDEPFKVNPVLNHNEAAVDSELALLGQNSLQISGPAPNPYYRNYDPLKTNQIPWLLLVCRLDAAEPATVRRMIDDSLAAEKTGLWGFAYVDSRGIHGSGGMGVGDEWLRRAASDVVRHDIPCIHDTAPSVFPEYYPMTRVALYLGWYTPEVEGAFKTQSVRFVPGAVAVHIHSNSADSLRKPLRNWCAPLLEQGAAATLGNVFEPYLSLTPHLDIFAERLRTGATFAEAAYASQNSLSWMTTFIGDPLYRPFKAQQNPLAEPARAYSEYAAYRDGAVLWAANGREQGEPFLAAKAAELKSGVLFEGLGLLQSGARDSAAALASWVQAGKTYTEDADRIRCALHVVEFLRAEKKKDQALAHLRQEIKRFASSDAAARLKAVELELDPPPPPPSPSPSPSPTPAAPKPQ